MDDDFITTGLYDFDVCKANLSGLLKGMVPREDDAVFVRNDRTSKTVIPKTALKSIISSLSPEVEVLGIWSEAAQGGALRVAR